MYRRWIGARWPWGDKRETKGRWGVVARYIGRWILSRYDTQKANEQDVCRG